MTSRDKTTCVWCWWDGFCRDWWCCFNMLHKSAIAPCHLLAELSRCHHVFCFSPAEGQGGSCSIFLWGVACVAWRKWVSQKQTRQNEQDFPWLGACRSPSGYGTIAQWHPVMTESSSLTWRRSEHYDSLRRDGTLASVTCFWDVKENTHQSHFRLLWNSVSTSTTHGHVRTITSTCEN